jgi:hypothetical protein
MFKADRAFAFHGFACLLEALLKECRLAACQVFVYGEVTSVAASFEAEDRTTETMDASMNETFREVWRFGPHSNLLLCGTSDGIHVEHEILYCSEASPRCLESGP